MRRALFVLLGSLLLASSASAAGAYVRLNEPAPRWGDTITFTAYQTVGTNVGILLVCGTALYHGTASGQVLYYEARKPLDAFGNPAATPGVEQVFPSFALSSQTVIGYCTAYLRNEAKAPTRVLAQTTFTVTPLDG